MKCASDTAANNVSERLGFAYNAVAGTLSAFQSVIIIVVLSRVCDLETVGIFTLAYAHASLFLNVGTFGMRKYQVSDRREEHSFASYRSSRAITCVCMLAMALLALALNPATNDYGAEKRFAIIAMCLYRMIDAVEDIYFGRYQQEGRLDVGACAMSLRLASTISLMCVAVTLSESLNVAIAVTTVYTTCFLVIEIAVIRHLFGMPHNPGSADFKSAVKLLAACLPLATAEFLLFYMGNAPKYAIDAMMGDADQAYYGYISMPIYIVWLLAGFIYNPMIASLAELWQQKELVEFLRRFRNLTLCILGITIACMLIGFVLGPPVLDLLFNANTAYLRLELCMLVAGGGFLGLTALATLGITIIRAQRILVPMHLVCAVLAFLVSNAAVAQWGLTGASGGYLAVMAAMGIVFSAAFVLQAKRLGTR